MQSILTTVIEILVIGFEIMMAVDFMNGLVSKYWTMPDISRVRPLAELPESSVENSIYNFNAILDLVDDMAEIKI